MTAILTPALALRYLRQLSTDVRAAIVLGADGAALAGDVALAEPAGRLLELLPATACELVVRVGDGSPARGSVLLARAGTGEGALALVLAVGPHALLDLVGRDAETALAALCGHPVAAAERPALGPGAVVLRDASRAVQVPESDEFAVQPAIFAGMGLFDAVAAAAPGAGA
jgi:hypothetical protein